MPERGSPNLARRRRLAAELRRLRERAGLTGDEATERLGWTHSSKLSRIELGKTGIKQADLLSLLDLYQVTSARRAELAALAEESRRSGPIQAASMRLLGEQIGFLEAEADAESIWIWEPQVVPGLFQTQDYTRVLFRAWAARFTLPGGEVDRKLEARRLRQEMLTRDPRPRVSAVIDESVLRRRIGAAAIMRRQLEHLAAISELPNVEIRILPLDGEHMVVTGAFNYLRFRQIHDVPLGDIVSFEHLTGMEDVEAESEVHHYSVVFSSLTESALDPETRPRRGHRGAGALGAGLVHPDAAVRHAATVALLVAALTQPLAALAFVFDGLILGISDYVAMRRAMILAIAGYVPVIVLVLRFHRLGLPGIWTALGLWLAARAALLGRRWRAEFRSSARTARGACPG